MSGDGFKAITTMLLGCQGLPGNHQLRDCCRCGGHAGRVGCLHQLAQALVPVTQILSMLARISSSTDMSATSAATVQVLVTRQAMAKNQCPHLAW